MKLKLFSRKLLGLDVSPEGLFLASIKKNAPANSVNIDHLLQAALPPTYFAQGELVDWDGLTDILKPLIKQYHLTHHPTAICLPAERVSLQSHTFPRDLPTKDIQIAIETHIAREFPGMQNAFFYDYTLLPKQDPLYMEALVTITRKAYLNQYVQAVTRAGLKVSVVDIDLYATLRTLLFSHSFSSHLINAVLFIEKNHATLILFSDERIIFYERINLSHSSAHSTQATLWSGLLQKLTLTIPIYAENNIETLYIYAEEKNWREYIEVHSPKTFHYDFCHLPNSNLLEITPFFCRALGLALWQKTNKGKHHAKH